MSWIPRQTIATKTDTGKEKDASAEHARQQANLTLTAAKAEYSAMGMA